MFTKECWECGKGIWGCNKECNKFIRYRNRERRETRERDEGRETIIRRTMDKTNDKLSESSRIFGGQCFWMSCSFRSDERLETTNEAMRRMEGEGDEASVVQKRALNRSGIARILPS